MNYNELDWTAKEIKITNAEQLREIVELTNSGERNFEGQTIIIQKNIDLKGSEENPWIPIGDKKTEGEERERKSAAIRKHIGKDADTEDGTYETADSEAFKGTFDGNGKVITGVFFLGRKKIKDGNGGQGLFASNAGVIKNLGVDVNIEDDIEVFNVAGGIVASNNGIIENCFSSGKIGKKAFTGGISGINFGNIVNCYSSVFIGIPEETLVDKIKNKEEKIASIHGGISGINSGHISKSYYNGNTDSHIAKRFQGLPGVEKKCYFLQTKGMKILTALGIGVSTFFGVWALSFFLEILALIPTIGIAFAVLGITIHFIVALPTVPLLFALELVFPDLIHNMTHTHSHTLATVIVYLGSLITGTILGFIFNKSRTEKQMRKQKTYKKWDFVNTWGIEPSKNNGFPYLQVFEKGKF